MAGNPNSLPPALGTGLWWWDAVAGVWSPVSGTTPLPVDATVSASVDGFAPNGSTATLAVTTSTGRVALPAGTVVLVSNTGSTTAFAKLGSGSVTAATTDIPIFGNSTIAMTVGANVDLAAITASGTTTLNLQGGTGLYAGSGGGSASGGGGGGAVTVADGADVAQGAIADAAYSSGSGTAIAILKGIYTKVAAVLSINIGQVNGATVPTGAGTASGAIRVALPTDQTLVGNITGTVAITGTPTVAVNIGTVAAAQSGGTIATTGTFQVGLAANASRKGALIQNTGTGAIDIYLGGTAAAQTATTALALQLGPLDSFNLNCGVANSVYTGVVSVTGTAAAPYVTIENI